jgi:nitroreductase
MDVRDAVATRFSCRAFLPTPVPEAVVRDLLERAGRAPSGGNLQPWLVHALAGDRLRAVIELIRPRTADLPRGEGTEYPIYPSPLGEPYRTRRFQIGELLYRSIGIAREDRAGRLRQYARNFEFFGAPVGIFVSVHRSLGAAQWSDLGMYMQTMMLLARAHRLDTCAQEAWAHWHRTVPAFLDLPADHMLVCGIALGHADHDAPINRWRAPREILEGFADLQGFDD